ncbi:MAG: flavodoxin family protein [Firmicutes bacterium]|nr:flavodoxin family protein [Bacillota bacterium]
MKILVLDGFPARENRIGELVCSIVGQNNVEHVRLADRDIAWCRGCFHCWLITPGECIIGDIGNDIARKFMDSELVVLLTPVTFGGYSSVLKKAVDRLIPNLSGLCTQYQGETHHVKRYSRYPALAILGVQKTPDSGVEEIFKELAERNRLNMYPQDFVSHVFNENTGANKLEAELASILGELGVVK